MTARIVRVGIGTTTVAALVGMLGCGGGDGGGGTPTGPSVPGTGAPGTSGATITIANGRVSPATVTIAVGQSVTFVNSDGTTRNVSSDPHPAHTQCPSINVVGSLANAQSRLTNAFPSAGTCGFHNHDDPDNSNFRGTIVIQ